MEKEIKEIKKELAKQKQKIFDLEYQVERNKQRLKDLKSPEEINSIMKVMKRR